LTATTPTGCLEYSPSRRVPLHVLEPFVSTPKDPWDAARAAHLARRAGFGGTPDEVAHLVTLGPKGAVAHFVDFAAVDASLEETLAALGGDLVDFAAGRPENQRVDALRRAWLFRMVHGSQPLQEKLTLLWHDHFAIQESKVVRAPMIDGYVRTLRAHSAGPFRELVGAVAYDPAMLHYLDNRLSTREAPNENWGRELVELFTLGVDNYDQRDVRELARVFTGWTTPSKNVNKFLFDPKLHDSGEKALFDVALKGQEGAAGVGEGEAALDRIVARRDCARFIARKLLTWFAEHEPSADIVDELADVLHEHDLVVREGLRVLFRSRWFLARERAFSMVRNPVDLVVAHARAVGLQNADRAGLERATRRMGMQLFEPPSVAGWEHGEAWTGPSTAAARLDVTLRLSELPHAGRRVIGRATIDLDALTAPARGAGGSLDLARLVDVMLARVVRQSGDVQRELDDARRETLVKFLEGARARTPEDLSDRKRDRRIARAALHLVLSLPEAAVA